MPHLTLIHLTLIHLTLIHFTVIHHFRFANNGNDVLFAAAGKGQGDGDGFCIVWD